jgi:hypothetical protein
MNMYQIRNMAKHYKTTISYDFNEQVYIVYLIICGVLIFHTYIAL